MKERLQPSVYAYTWSEKYSNRRII